MEIQKLRWCEYFAASIWLWWKNSFYRKHLPILTGRCWWCVNSLMAWTYKRMKMKMCVRRRWFDFGEDVHHQILEDIGLMKMLAREWRLLIHGLQPTKAATTAIALSTWEPVYLSVIWSSKVRVSCRGMKIVWSWGSHLNRMYFYWIDSVVVWLSIFGYWTLVWGALQAA